MAFDFDTFVIVPPLGPRFDDPALQDEIKSALHQRFSDCHFSISINSTERDGGTFTVIIAGSSDIDPKDVSEFEPTEEALAQMGEWLRGSVSMQIGMFLNTTYPPAKGRPLH